MREFSKLMIWSTVSHMTISLYSYKEVHVSQYDTDFKTFLLKYISKTLKVRQRYMVKNSPQNILLTCSAIAENAPALTLNRTEVR